ncbi:ATPase [Caerostris extrusa]|uniref:ATPase n=1 Tax=Caerostris extrusa TaxID=172846 RepID=A0AAV4UFL3_CAEEX|nr:ATPase [Caerostris extrusa]
MECVFSSYAVCKFQSGLRTVQKSINSHDAGLARFKGIRFLIVDELKKDQTLNSGFLKRVAGGRSSVDGRNMYSSKIFKFSWQAGIVLIMNEGDFPKFDSSDEAFMKRMVVCPFRSKFVDAGNDSSYTFVQDLNICEKFNSWRSSVLDLFWEYKYKDVTVPPEMLSWRETICIGNNLVEEWLNNSMTVTRDDNDRMTLHELSQKMFGYTLVGECFEKKLSHALRIGLKRKIYHFKDKLQKRVEGVMTGIRNVILGIRDSEEGLQDLHV